MLSTIKQQPDYNQNLGGSGILKFSVQGSTTTNNNMPKNYQAIH